MQRLKVADYHQLQRVDGKYVKEGSKVIRKGVKVDIYHIEEFNADFEQTGKMYIVDEKATEENHALRLKNQEIKAENEVKRSLNPLELVNAMMAKNSSEPVKSVKTEKVIEPEFLKHVVTESDVEENPELVLGSEIEIPNPAFVAKVEKPVKAKPATTKSKTGRRTAPPKD